MIKKLRKKFIVINMTLVSIVLVCVFLVICYFTYQQLYLQSTNSMQRFLSQNQNSSPFKPEIGAVHPQQQPVSATPVFSVLLDASGEITSSYTDNVTVSDEVLTEAAQKAFSSGKSEGILLDLNLHYLRQDTPEGVKIAFADISNEISSMKSLIFSLLLVGVGGLAAFFLISLFLSGWGAAPCGKGVGAAAAVYR